MQSVHMLNLRTALQILSVQGACSCVAYCLFCYELHATFVTGDAAKYPAVGWAFTASAPLIVFFGFMGPVQVACFIIHQYLILYLSEHYELLCKTIRSDAVGSRRRSTAVQEIFDLAFKIESERPHPFPLVEDKDRCAKLRAEIEAGFQLEDITRHVNRMLEPFLLLHFSISLMQTVLNLYGTSSILFYELKPLTYYMCLTYCFWSLSMVSVIYFVCESGQRLCDRRKEMKYNLEVACQGINSNMDEEQKEDKSLLLDRLSHTDPLSPYDYFDVNNACFLSICSTVITYLIVLTQFKVSEAPIEE